MKKIDLSNVEMAAKNAAANPMYVYESTANGFKFNTHWDAEKNWFESVMFFSRGWSHKHHIYAETIESLLCEISKEISESLKIYKNGGNF